jgi:hypothetical protein
VAGPDLRAMFERAKSEMDGRSAPLFVTGPHVRWMEMTEAEQQYSPEAITFVAAVLRGDYNRPRKGRFSPSSIGKCPRRVLFGFAGAPEVGENPDSSDLKGLGKWGHLRWQAEGLTLGWMEAGEVWTFDPARRIGGSIDGMNADDAVVELRSGVGPKFTRVVAQNQEVEEEHRLQVQVYAETEGAELASIVYEDRGTGDFHEFRVEPTDQMSRRLAQRLEELNNRVEDDDLPPMLDDCERRAGTIYRNCPYRKWCPTATRVAIKE